MIKLETYQDWKHCITELCEISLTLGFIECRLRELHDPQDFGTQRFIEV